MFILCSHSGAIAVSPPVPPSPAQIAYLARLTRISGQARLARYVARRLGLIEGAQGEIVLGKREFARAIDLELRERRLAA
jgi:hypothetical protein